MDTNHKQITATVVYEYEWHINRVATATSTYTTTYTNSPGFYTLWAMIVNTDMLAPSQSQVVGIPYTLAPSRSDEDLPPTPIMATKAVHSPTTDVTPAGQQLTSGPSDAVEQPALPLKTAFQHNILSGHQAAGASCWFGCLTCMTIVIQVITSELLRGIYSPASRCRADAKRCGGRTGLTERSLRYAGGHARTRRSR